MRVTHAAGHSHYPSIAAADDAVHLVWWDTRSGRPVIYYRRSTDSGLTWSAEGPISDADSVAAHTSIAVAGDAVHVVYVDSRDSQGSEVYYVRSLDRGSSWQPAVRLSDAPYNSYTPTIAASRENVYVAWTDTRDFKAGQMLEEEYFIRSTDRGATWG